MNATLPTGPEEFALLLESYGRLKRQLMLYLATWFEKELLETFQQRPARKQLDPLEINEAMESLLDRKLLVEQHDVIGCFLRDHPQLPGDERELVGRWKERTIGLFRVLAREGRVLEAHNLVDDLPYRLVATGGDEADLQRFGPGAFVFSRAVPLLDAWALCGIQSVLGEVDPLLVQGFAGQIARQFPATFFRNPRHLALAWAELDEQHAQFLSFFGQPWFVGTAGEVEQRYREFHAAKLAPRPPAGVAGAAEEGAARVVRAAAEAFRLPEPLRASTSVGLLSHPRCGLLLLPDFGPFVDVFRHGLAAGEPETIRGRLRGYLSSASIPPEVFETVAGAFPEHATPVLRLALDDPQLEWPRDAEACLRRFKPGAYGSLRLPPLLPLPVEMLRGLALLRRQEQGHRPGGGAHRRKAAEKGRKKGKR